MNINCERLSNLIGCCLDYRSLDDMGRRVDELEQNINGLMQQVILLSNYKHAFHFNIFYYLPT